MHKKLAPILFLFVLFFASYKVAADGSTIDKVYHPYVQLLEKEFEYRTLYKQDSDKASDGYNRHKVGYGQSLSDYFFAEAYLIGVDEPSSDFEIEAYEVELKWQLTEQGEYDNDWGLLFEIEKEKSENIWEANTTLIALHEWSSWIATGNLSIIYEWGADIDNELETSFAGQLRYRYSRLIEPGIELYLSQDTHGLGPVVNGLLRLGDGEKLNWELGAIFGANNDTSDVTWKFNLEYEFK